MNAKVKNKDTLLRNGCQFYHGKSLTQQASHT